MPIYEYQCRVCGRRFEILQGLGEGSEGLSCPACGEQRLDKQFSTFASGSSDTSSARTSAASRGCGPASGFG